MTKNFKYVSYGAWANANGLAAFQIFFSAMLQKNEIT
jgi:hypothetical protein